MIRQCFPQMTLLDLILLWPRLVCYTTTVASVTCICHDRCGSSITIARAAIYRLNNNQIVHRTLLRECLAQQVLQ